MRIQTHLLVGRDEMTGEHRTRRLVGPLLLARLGIATCLLLAVPAGLRADSADDDIRLLLRAGPQAVGSVEAAEAVERLSQQGPEVLPRLLESMGTPNVVAANWCRVAFQQIVDRERAKSAPSLPIEELTRFVRDPQQSGRARRLALDVLTNDLPNLRATLLAESLSDPEFRRDAVAQTLAQAEKAIQNGQSDEARTLLERAFQHARDSEQVLRAVVQLRKVGVAVDPITQMGFLPSWYLLGPFDAPAMSGFAEQFPPERNIDLAGEYDLGKGKSGRWKPYRTNDALGQIDLIRAIGAVEEAVGYAYCEIDSPLEQHCELRCSADDNLSVWLNGEQVLAREQWLNGTRLDRFITPVRLKQGTNRLLVKICQGPRHVDPDVPNNWSFQLRLCDATGGGVAHRTALPATEKPPGTD